MIRHERIDVTTIRPSATLLGAVPETHPGPETQRSDDETGAIDS
jgi:hypothetical protein